LNRLTELGSTAGTLRGDAFRAFILRDRTKWQQLAKDANISSQ
jgi:hypothetical protein